MLLFVSHKPDWGRKLLRALEESIDQRHLGAVHLGHVVIPPRTLYCIGIAGTKIVITRVSRNVRALADYRKSRGGQMTPEQSVLFQQ